MLLIVGAQAGWDVQVINFWCVKLINPISTANHYWWYSGTFCSGVYSGQNRQGKPCFCKGGGVETSGRRAGVVMDLSVGGWLVADRTMDSRRKRARREGFSHSLVRGGESYIPCWPLEHKKMLLIQRTRMARHLWFTCWERRSANCQFLLLLESGDPTTTLLLLSWKYYFFHDISLIILWWFLLVWRICQSIEALDHVVFHYEARVSEGGPANADHSSLERLPADLRQLRTVRIASL